MKVLSLTYPDWDVLFSVYQTELKHHPLQGTTHECEPHVYMGALDFDRSITQALQDSEIILNHYFISMIGTVDEELLLELTKLIDLHINHHPANKRYTHVLLLSGTLRQWRDTCRSMCQDVRSKDCVKLGNDIVQTLERFGFRDCFKIYHKKPSSKGFLLS